jgi:hypothetical protein
MIDNQWEIIVIIHEFIITTQLLEQMPLLLILAIQTPKEKVDLITHSYIR